VGADRKVMWPHPWPPRNPWSNHPDPEPDEPRMTRRAWIGQGQEDTAPEYGGRSRPGAGGGGIASRYAADHGVLLPRMAPGV
jgi:hypothetical protein